MRFQRCQECGTYGYIKRNGYCRQCAANDLSLERVIVEGTPASSPNVSALSGAIEARADNYDSSRVTTTSSQLRWRVTDNGNEYTFQVGDGFIGGTATSPSDDDEARKEMLRLLDPLVSQATLDTITHVQSVATISFDGDLDFLPRLQTAMYDKHAISMTSASYRPSVNGIERFEVTQKAPCTVTFTGSSEHAIRDAIEQEGWHETMRSVLDQ